MLALAIVAAMTGVSGPNTGYVSPDQVTYITPARFEPWDPKVDDAVVAEFPGTWVNPVRTRLDPDGKAPDWIVVRHRDGLFAIDPFVEIPDVDLNTMRELFKPVKYGTNGPAPMLHTDQSLFGWQRWKRTEQLFEALETARVMWLAKNGYTRSVREFSGSAAGAQSNAGEPAFVIPMPEDKPRTKPVERVEKPAPKAIVMKGEEPVKISMPDLGVSAEVRERVAARNEKAADASREQQQASAEQKKTDETTQQ